MPFKKNQFYCLEATSHLSLHFLPKINGDPLWSCRALKDEPDAVVATHVNFINAGANIITTNTYQVNLIGVAMNKSRKKPEDCSPIRHNLLFVEPINFLTR